MKTSHERALHKQEIIESELQEEKAALQNAQTVFDEKIRQLQKQNLEQDMSYTEVRLVVS